MTHRHTYILLALLLSSMPIMASEKSDKAAAFFFRIGQWVDHFQLSGLDTAYITLPEHSWSVALNNSEVGINDTYTTWVDPATPISLRSQTTPSVPDPEKKSAQRSPSSLQASTMRSSSFSGFCVA